MDFPIGSPALFSGNTLSEGKADHYVWILAAFALTVVIVALAGLASGVFAARRRFWCASAKREVEVSFRETGLPGFRRPMAVQSCSRFDRPTEVTCQRDCLDRDVRVKLPMTSFLSGGTHRS